MTTKQTGLGGAGFMQLYLCHTFHLEEQPREGDIHLRVSSAYVSLKSHKVFFCCLIIAKLSVFACSEFPPIYENISSSCLWAVFTKQRTHSSVPGPLLFFFHLPLPLPSLFHFVFELFKKSEILNLKCCIRTPLRWQG